MDATLSAGSAFLPLDAASALIGHAIPIADWVLVMPLILCLSGGAILVMLRGWPGFQPVFAALVALAVLVCDAYILMRVLDTGPFSMTMGSWLPPFGISFTADVLGAGFALAAALVVLAVFAYAPGEIGPGETRFGFYPLVLLLLAGVSGAFLTGDIFNLYVWFEVLLIASLGLLVLGGRPIQLDAAVKYAFMNVLATALFLVALAFLYGQVGTLNMADIVGAAAAADPATITATAALLLLAFGAKASLFPVNTWLPASYHAPPAVISALFGAILTKVGAYALLRALIVLLPQGRDWLDPVITGLVVATLVLAPLGAIAETNLRRAIGFFVIGSIGLIITGAALPNPSGVAGATIYGAQSMLVIAALYMVAGVVEKAAGTTDTRRMGGLYAAAPFVSGLFLFLMFTLAGLPPLSSFWPKVMLIEASYLDGSFVLLAAILLNAFLTLIAGTRLWAHIFWRAGPEGEASEQPATGLVLPRGAARAWAYAPAGVLVAILLCAGLLPNALVSAGRIAAGDMLEPQRYVEAVGLAPRAGDEGESAP